MDADRIRSLANTAGHAEAAKDAARNLRIATKVQLTENFATQLTDELTEIEDRLDAIHRDLSLLSFANDPDVGWGEERYRLANRGAPIPNPDEDRAQLEAIEGAKAA